MDSRRLKLVVAVPRLVGSSTAGVAPGSLTLEISISAAGVDTYFLHKRYRELTALQAELIQDGTLTAPVLIPASKSVNPDARRVSAETLLQECSQMGKLHASVAEFFELAAHGVGAPAAGAAATPRRPSQSSRRSEPEPQREQPASRPKPSVETPRTAAPAGAGEPALGLVLEKAVASGLTTPQLAAKMHDNVKSGKFTESHYVKMWSGRLSEAGISLANDAAASSPPTRPRGGSSSSTSAATKTPATSVAAVAKIAAASSPPPRESRAPPAAEPASRAGRSAAAAAAAAAGDYTIEEARVLLQEAVSLGLTSSELVAKMLDNVRRGKFTPQHYRDLWTPQVEEARTKAQPTPMETRAKSMLASREASSEGDQARQRADSQAKRRTLEREEGEQARLEQVDGERRSLEEEALGAAMAASRRRESAEADRLEAEQQAAEEAALAAADSARRKSLQRAASELDQVSAEAAAAKRAAAAAATAAWPTTKAAPTKPSPLGKERVAAVAVAASSSSSSSSPTKAVKLATGGGSGGGGGGASQCALSIPAAAHYSPRVAAHLSAFARDAVAATPGGAAPLSGAALDAALQKSVGDEGAPLAQLPNGGAAPLYSAKTLALVRQLELEQAAGASAPPSEPDGPRPRYSAALTSHLKQLGLGGDSEMTLEMAAAAAAAAAEGPGAPDPTAGAVSLDLQLGSPAKKPAKGALKVETPPPPPPPMPSQPSLDAALTGRLHAAGHACDSPAPKSGAAAAAAAASVLTPFLEQEREGARLGSRPEALADISDAQLARMSREQLAETMRQAQQQHARLHRLTGALLDLQERVARRL